MPKIGDNSSGYDRSIQTTRTARRAASQTLRSFVIVGGVGFAIEAILLTTITQFVGWTPWQARVPSFLTAVLVTWVLNRMHTFPGRGLEHRSIEALSYVAIQVCGATINLAVFGACLLYFPRLGAMPVIPLGIGAAGGFAFNFAVSNILLYSRPQANISG